MIEEWKLIDEKLQRKNQYEEPKLVRYYVSNLGRCRVDNKIIELTRKQYYVFHGDTVHRWVAKMFIPNPESLPCVDHIDTNIHNNRADNLRWVDSKGNANNELTKVHQSEGQLRNGTNSERAKKQWEENYNKMLDAIHKSQPKRTESIRKAQNTQSYHDTMSNKLTIYWNNLSDNDREKRVSKNYKKVSQYTLDGKYIRTYNSLKEAGKDNNIRPNSISLYLNGYTTNGCGYIWKYAN